mmetsp:Transcript_27555/g.40699  ORF Transcript_27555/g.40699 Transcript_27555/m.40699 type:complete len:155 (-) Transcript_27555:160-624(-)
MIKNFVVLLFLLINTDGFSPSPVAPRVSQLNLLPEQGNQLAAACEASFTHHPDDDLSQKQCSTSAARKFVARIFSLPSSLFHKSRKISPIIPSLDSNMLPDVQNRFLLLCQRHLVEFNHQKKSCLVGTLLHAVYQILTQTTIHSMNSRHDRFPK